MTISFQIPAFSFDENVISIKSSIVDIAHGYTKKKNVFRLKTYNGSEFLLQAEDSEAMKAWIQTIQNNNNPDADVSHQFNKAHHFLLVDVGYFRSVDWSFCKV